MDNPLVIDTEVTTSNKGNPYDVTNRLVCYSWWYQGKADAALDSVEIRQQLQKWIAECSVFVLFNSKFDMAWLRRQGISVSGPRIWDTQLAEFILSDQRQRYPSLENAAVKYGLGHKIDVVNEEYWKKGIDTDQIPWDVLREYATQDALLTYQVYQHQRELLKGLQGRLFSLHCQDIPVLLDMEWNGLKFDFEAAAHRKEELQKEYDGIIESLSSIYPDVPINFGSVDQLSAFLYGGTIKEEVKEHIGYYKTGAKAGQPKYRNAEREHVLPRLFKPLPGSEMKKEGVFSTSDDTLQKLKGNKKLIAKLRRKAALEQLIGLYFEGIPKLHKTMNWEEGIIHGQLNQVVAQTGRLSAVKPNQQNLHPEAQQFFVTRY